LFSVTVLPIISMPFGAIRFYRPDATKPA